MTSERVELYSEDKKLKTGSRVEVYWLENGRSCKALGQIDKLRTNTVSVQLNGRAVIGVKQVSVPRYGDFSRWSPNNCVHLVPVNQDSFRHKDYL